MFNIFREPEPNESNVDDSEDNSQKKNVPSEIKIAGTDEPAGKNLTKASDKTVQSKGLTSTAKRRGAPPQLLTVTREKGTTSGDKTFKNII